MVGEHWSGSDYLSKGLKQKQGLQGRHAATPSYVASKWGFVARYDRYGWGRFTTQLPPAPMDVMAEQDRRAWLEPPRFRSPWNSGKPVGFWEFRRERHAFIRSSDP